MGGWVTRIDNATTESLSEKWSIAGTFPYMAPEQLLGQEIDTRTDIHAVGSVLYEMATGRRPFIEAERSQLIGAILRKPPQLPKTINHKLSPELEWIITKCLEKDPENRYQSAKELAVDLRRLGAPEHEHSSVASVRRRPRITTPLGLTLLSVLAAVLAMAVVVIGFNPNRWRQRLFGSEAKEQIHSLVVLPLVNLSGDAQQEYFADGMTEELITDLSKIGSLKVISRTSAMQYKNARKGLPQIGRELGVEGVVEGSVQRVGDRVRISAQLIYAATDTHLWAESYDRDLRDVLRLEGEVAQVIANEVNAKLTPQEQERLSEKQPIDPEAHQAYLRGRYY